MVSELGGARGPVRALCAPGRLRFQFTLRSLFIVLFVAAAASGVWMQSDAIYMRIRYGPRVDLASVRELEFMDWRLLLEIEGTVVFTAESTCLRDASADQIWPKNAKYGTWTGSEPDSRIRGVWRTRDPRHPYVVRICDELVTTTPTVGSRS